MIESIHVANTATYKDVLQSLTGLKTFTYVYGPNGSGKTTISRVIAKPGDPAHADCRIDWKGGAALDALVYNRDFVQANFGQGTIKGVFTLGKQSVEDAELLRVAAADVTKRTAEILALLTTLKGADGAGGKKADLEALDQWLQEKCWTQKVKHSTKLSAAFEGYRNDKSKFRRRVLEEFTRVAGTERPPTLTDMETKAETVFGPTPVLGKVCTTPRAVLIEPI